MVSAQNEKYIALLRGINVGGHKKVPMAELRSLYESLKFNHVTTLLNSGNVVFEARKTSEATLIKKIEEAFQKNFGFGSNIVLRTMSDIKQLIAMAPFKSIKVDKNVRLYVTFLGSTQKSSLKLPYTSPEKDFRILKKTDREVFSVLTVKTAKSVNAMAFIEEEFGRDVTTRNWNTIQKIAALD